VTAGMLGEAPYCLRDDELLAIMADEDRAIFASMDERTWWAFFWRGWEEWDR